MNTRIVPIFIISIIWAIIFNIAKKTTEYSNDLLNLVFVKAILLGILAFVGLSIYQFKNAISIENIKNMDKKIWVLLISSVILEIISSYFYFYSLQENQLSWVVPLIEAGIIFFSIVLSLLFFKEELNLVRFLGIGLIIGGIFLVYYN